MIKKTDLKESLLNQLRNKGADTPHFLDIVETYMNFWTIKSDLAKDIRKRGAIVSTDSGDKPNPSIAELRMVTKQMQSLLDQLELSVDDVGNYDGYSDL